jgi:hypothetical protein
VHVFSVVILIKITYSVLSEMSSETIEVGEQCPFCGCILDKEGRIFSSRFEMNESVYYCNNPICHGRS